jgi:hypothetical protein
MSETTDLEPDTQVCRYRTTNDYHYMPIGEGRFLIPLQSVLDVLAQNGAESHNVTKFSACHEYVAESRLVLDGDASGGASAAKATSKTPPPLPVGVRLPLALLNPIDTRTAAAGDAVSAKVTKAVRAPGSNVILVAAGAIAHGRLVQMRHQIDSGQFLIAIHYTTLEQNGVAAPLSIRLDRELRAEEQSKNRLSTRGTEFSLPQPAPTGENGSWFVLPAAAGNVVMRAGSESKWVTVAN